VKPRVPGRCFFAAVRVNQRKKLAGFCANPAARWSEECPFHDRIGAHRAKPALYIRRARAASADYRTLAALRTPTDIFPDIRIPVIGVVWNYTGLPPDQMADA